jgi:biofilm PGA synthesis lipoprotein PgaB
MKRVLLIVGLVLLMGGRAFAVTPVLVLCYHNVRDDVEGHSVKGQPNKGQPNKGQAEIYSNNASAAMDADQYATSTRNLASQFDWLQGHGYHAISLQQLIDAREKHGTLPSKPVLLTFDDGLRSVYTKVFPLLKAYHYPAVVAVVGAWADLAPKATVDYGPRPFTRADFATWDELREMQASGLVEIASHTYNMHRGIIANPQGNVIPAVTTHAYDPKTHRYETDAEYEARLREDFKHSSEEIRAKLGRAPRAIMWPYGAYTGVSDRIAASVGMPITFSLDEERRPDSKTLQDIPRLLVKSNMSTADFAWLLLHPLRQSAIRAVQVDLDYIYDPNPAQQEKNLGALLDRIKAMNVSQVWLQAFADPDGNDSASAVYFPNRHLPMRADLFSRAAWQLRTRAGVQVFAWLPVLAWRLPDAKLQARLQIQPGPKGKPEKPVRLNPFLPETQKIVGDMYEDMARSVPVAGILFHDDAILRDTDLLGPDAPPPGPARTQALIAFTEGLTARVERWRPMVKTARNLFAEPVLHPASETWYAQSLPAFLSTYDEVALMAMPQMENAKDSKAWLKKLAGKVAAQPDGMEKTVFELQTEDWRTRIPIPTPKLAKEMVLLQSQGAVHLAYYPDDFLHNHPNLKKIRTVFSTSDFPAPQR